MYLFNKKWYLKKYPQAINYEKGAFMHYVEIGWKMNYNPSRHFSTEKYLLARPDVKANNICPLIHYLKYGIREGAKRFETNEQNYKKRPLMVIEKKVSYFFNRDLIEKNKNVKVLIIFNLYYIESIDEVVYYINNISPYNYDLIITYSNKNYKNKIIGSLKKFNIKAKLLNVDNIGYDIYPFLLCLNNVDINNYDVIYKLHSKRTYMVSNYSYSGNLFLRNRDWFLYLFDSILGPYNVHHVIDKILNNRNIGMVCSNIIYINDSEKYKYLTKLTALKAGFNIDENYKYCAGTCFAVNKQIALIYKNIRFTKKLFDLQIGNYFSFAHFVERYFGALVNMNNYDVETIKSNKLRVLSWKKISKKLNKYEACNIIKDIINELPKEVLIRNMDIFLKDYQFEEIEIDKIIVKYDGDYLDYKITETVPYLYSTKKIDGKEYADYCRKYRRTDYLDKTNDEFNSITDQSFCSRFNELENYFIDNKTLVEEPIIVNQNYELLDGLHRLSLLSKMYGINYKVKVLILNIAYFDLESAVRFTSRIGML